MGTHPIFESDFDCLTDFEMVLECVRIKHVPNSVSERDLEDDWGDLNISENGIYFLQDKLYVFFNDKRDAEDAQNRGLSFNKKILKAKQLSIDDCITEMRPLVQDEKRQAIKYGEKYEYPVIFEKHKIRIKWEDSKIVQHTPPTPLKETKPVCLMTTQAIDPGLHYFMDINIKVNLPIL